MDDIELRKWAVQIAVEKFDGYEVDTILEIATALFQYVQSGKLPDKTDQQ